MLALPSLGQPSTWEQRYDINSHQVKKKKLQFTSHYFNLDPIIKLYFNLDLAIELYIQASIFDKKKNPLDQASTHQHEKSKTQIYQ